MNELDKWKAINSCRTRDELKTAILAIADDSIISGSGKLAQEQAAYIDMAIDHDMMNRLTRSYGIRQQAMYLKYCKR